MPTFSLPRVTLALDGSLILREFAGGGDAITISLDGPDFKAENVWGKVLHIQQPNRAGKLKFKLAQSASENDRLSTMRAQDVALGTATHTFVCKDSNGTDLISGGWSFGTPAGAGYGTEHSAREWELNIDVAAENYHLGGLL